jgi:glycosyltransferase involved in cell wall biosynthesis
VAGVSESELVKRSRKSGLRVYDELELRRGFRPGSFFRDQRRLKRFWGEFKPDGILTNGSQDTWSCALARRRFGTKAFLVRWRHNSFAISGHLFNRWLYRKLIDHVVVSSSEIGSCLTDPGLVDAERITVFSPSTPLDEFLHARPGCGIRAQLGVPDDGFLVLSVGRLAPEKGHDTLVRAWRKVADEVPGARLAIAGLGSQQEPLERLISERSLEGRVHLIGFRDDVPALYAESDLSVLAPVGGESFGIALLEAYASGKACVATDVGGVRDLVVDGETGYLVKAGDESAIAEALLKCLRDRDRCARMAEAGKARVLERFTPAKLANTAEALFDRLSSST